MNRTEFNEIQEQMAQSLIVYERFCKKANYLKAKYNSHFSKYTEQEVKYKLENDLMVNVIKMLNDKKSLDEVDKIIEKGKAIYVKAMVDMANEFKHDDLVVKSFENADVQEVENAYEQYTRINHPAIKMQVSNNEAQLYQALRSLYFQNNLSAFNSVLQMNQNLISTVEYTEDKFVEYYKYYMNTARQIQNDMENKLKNFPFTKEEIFQDDMSIASEEGELRAKINKLAGINKSLHKDFINVYGEDLNL